MDFDGAVERKRSPNGKVRGLAAIFRQIIANNRAGGWRTLKVTRADHP